MEGLKQLAKEALEKNHAPVKRYGESFIVASPVEDVRKLTVANREMGGIKRNAWERLSDEDKERIMSVDLSDPYLAWQVANMDGAGARIIYLKEGEKRELEIKGGGLYWIILAKGAELNMEDRILNNELAVRRMFVWQYERSKFSLSGWRAGNDWLNERLRVELLEEGALNKVRHLTCGKEKEQLDIEAAVYHKASKTESDLTVRMIAAGKSINIYRGVISVDRGASGVRGRETAKALMLSRRAVVDVLPQLNVNSDDVQCDHGVGIEQLDKEKLMYLRSRGLSEEEARKLMMSGFLKESMKFSEKVEKSLENMVNRGFK